MPPNTGGIKRQEILRVFHGKGSIKGFQGNQYDALSRKGKPISPCPIALITTLHPVFKTPGERTGINKSPPIHTLPVHQASAYGYL